MTAKQTISTLESIDLRCAYLRNMKQSNQAWNSPPQNVPECSLFHAGPILKIYANPFPHFSAMLVSDRQTNQYRWKHYLCHFEGVLLKGPYPPCLRMVDRALLAGYPRFGRGYRYIIGHFISDLAFYQSLCKIWPSGWNLPRHGLKGDSCVYQKKQIT